VEAQPAPERRGVRLRNIQTPKSSAPSQVFVGGCHAALRAFVLLQRDSERERDRPADPTMRTLERHCIQNLKYFVLILHKIEQ